MGSGNKREKLNTLERLVSTDFNRLQSMLAADSHEYARWRNNREIVGDWHNQPGLQQAYTALPPDADKLIAHDCLSGLLVRPDNATSLLVDPGEAAFFVPAYPNATADDSKYVAVSDAGVQSLGILTFSANAGPGVRWDIVECQPTEALLESASRDIYNPATGQYAPATVEKVRGGQLTYRIRRGTQGAGIPDIAADWMPLAAVHLRTDATSFLNCDVYDLRPLVRERCMWSPSHPLAAPSGTNGVGYRLHLEEAELGHSVVATTDKAMVGYWRGHFGGYWTGGRLRCNVAAESTANFGSTGTFETNVDRYVCDANVNLSNGYSATNNTSFMVCALFPRGYPRWVRYSQLALTGSTSNRLRASGRLPQGPRGILVTAAGAARGDGIVRPTNLPPQMGETQGAWGHVVAEGVFGAAGEVLPAFGGANDRKFLWPSYSVTRASGGTPTARSLAATNLNLTASVNTSTAGVTSFDFTLTRSYPIPPYARAVLIEFNLLFTFAANDYVVPFGAFLHQGAAGVADMGARLEWGAPGGPTDGTGSHIWDCIFGLWVPLFPSNVSFDDDGAPAGNPSILSFTLGHVAAPSSATGLAVLAGYQL